MHDELIFENCDHSRDPVLGCALEGVASIVAGIQDVGMVIHSPQGCAATVAMAFDSHEIDFTRRKVACTRLFESDIIMGASEKLINLVKETDRTFKNKAIFVVGTCAADIIGENLEGLCRQIQPEVSAKLIPIVAGGFRGNIYDGMELGLKALLPLIKKSEIKKQKSVNIIAPQANLNPTWFADLKWVIDILYKMEVEVQAVLAHNTSLEELENAGTAAANILLSHDSGFAFAKRMRELHGIPLILADIPLPVGLKNTARWLKALGIYFDAEAQAEQLIKDGDDRVVDILRRRALMIIPRYRNCKIAISADATIGIGLVRLLFEELEMIPELILFRSQTPESRRILERELKGLGISPRVAFGVDGFQIQKALQDVEISAVIGSAWEKYMAEELGIKIAFDVLAPTNRDIYLDRAYFGYEGMLNMLEIVGNDWEKTFRSKEIDWEEFQSC